MQLRFDPVVGLSGSYDRDAAEPRLCLTVVPSRTAEGVGFEPTVGLPTLDFESSALNRTQPPFQSKRKETLNVQRPMLSVQSKKHLLMFWSFFAYCLI